MKFKLTYLATLAAAVACSALFSADTPSAKTEPQILLLRVYLSTNAIPGYVGGPEVDAGSPTNTWEPQMSLGLAVVHPPHTEVVTNYVLGYREGTNAVEIVTLVKH